VCIRNIRKKKTWLEEKILLFYIIYKIVFFFYMIHIMRMNIEIVLLPRKEVFVFVAGKLFTASIISFLTPDLCQVIK